ncbi:MAG: helix-hairpin-helix domain-containing protein [Tannerella sp.]|jgi:DNA uptake protein ComE-like DNA-binding protein|nr:helix-hairpin-helix domain-containing protein [Tannerella sp.]
MSWRDFFYFSKGERNGLIILLCLIVVAGILLILNNQPETVRSNVGEPVIIDNGLTDKTEISGSQSETIPADEKFSTSSSGQKDRSSQQSFSSEDVLFDSKTSTSDKRSQENSAHEEIASKSGNTKESVSERVKRLTSYSRPSYPRSEKFAKGTIVELNTADTTILKKIPGIGSAFAKRIVNYRNLLGGYYSVTQLNEVYGIDEERYDALKSWFTADPSLVFKLDVNKLPQDSLRRHPYINYGQSKVITQLRRQKGKLTGWENLQLLDEFTDSDKIRLLPYLSFD